MLTIAHALQFFLASPALEPAALALALEALGLLCERGGISFPDAWKLLREARLQRPEQELRRAAWTALLGHAHAAAEKHPEQASAHQQTLWEAVKDPSARVLLPILAVDATSPLSTGTCHVCHGELFLQLGTASSNFQLHQGDCLSGRASAPCSTKRALELARGKTLNLGGLHRR